MADKSQSGTLEDDEFVLFYKMLTQREDVLKVFQQFSADGQKLSLRDLEDFLRDEQLEGDEVQQQAKQLIERYEPSDTGACFGERVCHADMTTRPDMCLLDFLQSCDTTVQYISTYQLDCRGFSSV